MDEANAEAVIDLVDATPNAVYLVAGTDGRLHPVADWQALSLWCGIEPVGDLVDPDGWLTIVSVVRSGLRPKAAFVVSLRLEGGRVGGPARKIACADTMAEATDHDGPRGKAIRDMHEYDLPKDWRTQLAVYLDSPAEHFREFVVGGPLPLADQGKAAVSAVVAQLAGG